MASLAWQTFKPTHKGLLGNPRKSQPAQKGISSQLCLNGNSESRSAAECKQHTYTSLLNSISPFAGGGDQAQPPVSTGTISPPWASSWLRTNTSNVEVKGQEKIVLLSAAARPCQLLPGSGFPGGPSPPAFCVVFSVSESTFSCLKLEMERSTSANTQKS